MHILIAQKQALPFIHLPGTLTVIVQQPNAPMVIFIVWKGAQALIKSLSLPFPCTLPYAGSIFFCQATQLDVK